MGLKNKLTVDVTRALKATKNGKVMISVVLGHNLFVAFALPSTQNIFRLLKKISMRVKGLDKSLWAEHWDRGQSVVANCRG